MMSFTATKRVAMQQYESPKVEMQVVTSILQSGQQFG